MVHLRTVSSATYANRSSYDQFVEIILSFTVFISIISFFFYSLLILTSIRRN